MTDYEIIWPEDFDDYAWLIESKGWLDGVKVRIGERIIEPVFYDSVRLSQDVEAELSSYGYFAESMLIVLDRVTKNGVEKLIRKMVQSGAFDPPGREG